MAPVSNSPPPQLPPEGERLAPDEVRRGVAVGAFNATRGVVLAHSLRLALGPWSRLSGLLRGPPLGRGEGMLLRPCNSVHTMMMRYTIDVAFLDERGHVVGLCSELRPWSMSGAHRSALCTLELFAGTLAESTTVIGDAVEFVRIA